MIETPPGLAQLEERLGYRFRDLATIAAALTHASVTAAARSRAGERLEFLGDAVLGLAFSDLLLQRFPDYDEGRLSKFRASLVSTRRFASKARELELNRIVALGKGEEKTGGREKASILAAVFEAVMGAIFLEAGYDGVRDVVASQFRVAIEQIAETAPDDPKTELQELCQEVQRTTPGYRVSRESGPDHARWFAVDVLLGETVLASGEGPSKRQAEQAAAEHALALCLSRLRAGQSLVG